MDFTRSMWSQFWSFGGDFNIDKMVPSWRLHMRQALHRGNGGCPSSPRPEVTQLSLYWYVSGASQVAAAPLELR